MITATGTRTELIPSSSNKATVEFTITPRSAEQVDRFFSEIVLEANQLGLKGIKIIEIQAEHTHGIPRDTIIRFVVGDNEESATPDNAVDPGKRALRRG